MPGTKFNHGQLATEVAGNYDLHIAALTEELDSLLTLSDEQRHTAWRASAERAVIDLAKRIGDEDVTDAELSRFTIGSPPWPGDQDFKEKNLERRLADAEKNKHKALAYIRALQADESGTVEVFAADLKRIGYGL